MLCKFYGKDKVWFVATYSVFHLGFFFCLSVIIYYMRQPKFSLSALKKMAQQVKKDRIFSKPTHIERLVMLIIANVFNICL